MHATRINQPNQKLSLSKIATTPPRKLTKERAVATFQKYGAEIFELQQLMYGAGTHSLLLVLQGRDAAGKDGTIKRVAGYLNPRGVIATSFGVPSREELSHDFLWRVHPHCPAKGAVAIFNRSHYEDVLVVRVHNLVEPAIWRKRYESINGFERTLALNNTIIVKCFLHISKAEQEERLLERETDPRKAFKINPNDWAERKHWNAYSQAYQAAFQKCSSKQAPWYVIPSDKKWYRNLCIAEVLRQTLRPYRKSWERTLAEMGKERRADLAAFRAG